MSKTAFNTCTSSGTQAHALKQTARQGTAPQVCGVFTTYQKRKESAPGQPHSPCAQSPEWGWSISAVEGTLASSTTTASSAAQIDA